MGFESLPDWSRSKCLHIYGNPESLILRWLDELRVPTQPIQLGDDQRGFLIGFADMGILSVLGVILLISGGLSANVVICSECRAKVDKKAKICPHCRSAF